MKIYVNSFFLCNAQPIPVLKKSLDNREISNLRF